MFSTPGERKSTRKVELPKGETENAAREWARPYHWPWIRKWGGTPNVGLLRKKLEPLEKTDGREVTIRRWEHYVAGLNPRFFPKGDVFTAAVIRFASAPKAYDDPDWHMSERELAEYARLTEGL